MNSDSGLTITAPDRVLIHLKDYLRHPEDREFPRAITQRGISESTGMRLTHVPRTLKKLEERELVSSAKGHVDGERRRYKVYFLTGKGLEEANAALEHLGKQEVPTPEGTVKIGDMLDSRKGHALPILMELAGESAMPSRPERRVVGPIPDTGEFIDRERELGELEEMLADPKNKLMVIYGSQGYGASALAARFAMDTAAGWSVAWVEMQKEPDKFRKAVLGTLAEAVPDLGEETLTAKSIAKALDGKKVILVLDCYYDVSEEVVEFLVGLVGAIKATADFKLLVTARENTPAYNRFYTIMDQHDGTVGEVHIRGLDIEHCQILLGTPDIDPDAMKRLYLFTRGKPPTLKLLARGKEKDLREQTSFSPEEISLMLFLKKQKKA